MASNDLTDVAVDGPSSPDCGTGVVAEVPVASHAGFLPVPLLHIPSETLSDLKVYLPKGGQYILYRDEKLPFGRDDMTRLLKGGVDFVYVSVKDHQRYYQTIERHLARIIADPKILKAQKAEFLYATTLELVQEVLTRMPGTEEISRINHIAGSMTEFVLRDRDAFSYLHDVSNHDFFTATHMVNVCAMVVAVAVKMNMHDVDTLRDLAVGALLHDIGKIFIPSELLNSPAKMTPEEMSLMRTHVEKGREYLAKICCLPPLAMALICDHHERMDGSGYPQALRGKRISLPGRIGGVVDTFEAMTSIRPYNDHVHSPAEALEHIQKNVAILYDPDVVNALVQTISGDKSSSSLPFSSEGCGTGENGGREAERRYFRLSLTVRPLISEGGKWITGSSERVIAHNISRTGLGFLSTKRFDINQPLYIDFPELDTYPAKKMLAVVVRSQNHGDGWLTHGCRFHEVLDDEIVDAIRGGVPVKE